MFKAIRIWLLKCKWKRLLNERERVEKKVHFACERNNWLHQIDYDLAQVKDKLTRLEGFDDEEIEQETRVRHKEMTDEEIYQDLKKTTSNKYMMGAEKWKRERLKQLKREGKVWSK